MYFLCTSYFQKQLLLTEDIQIQIGELLIDNKWGWFWMELPALVLMPAIILFSPVEKNGIIVLIIGLWILHYFYRTILFPIKLKTKGKKMPISDC